MRYILLLSLLLIGCEREELRVSEEVVIDSALIVGWEEAGGEVLGR